MAGYLLEKHNMHWGKPVFVCVGEYPVFYSEAELFMVFAQTDLLIQLFRKISCQTKIGAVLFAPH
ncbi:MAG: hypothetical protein OIF55_16195 [Amphritea sp.]|nr:hypothetical protein [Amphritea sp.]